MRLTRLERNKLFEAIAASNLDPAECELVANDDMYVITHKSGSRAEIKHVQSRGPKGMTWLYIINFTIADGLQLPDAPLPTFDMVKPYIERWANEVWKITTAPDLWSEAQRNGELIKDIQRSNVDNTPFTQNEQKQIAAHLQRIAEEAKETFDLTPEQASRIDEWKDESAEASTRMGRKDFQLLVYGSIINQVLNDTLTPGVARHILVMFIHVVAHLFLGGSEPPHLLS